LVPQRDKPGPSATSVVCLSVRQPVACAHFEARAAVHIPPLSAQADQWVGLRFHDPTRFCNQSIVVTVFVRTRAGLECVQVMAGERFYSACGVRTYSHWWR